MRAANAALPHRCEIAPDDRDERQRHEKIEQQPENPEFITLVNSENLHQAKHIAGNRQLRGMLTHVDPPWVQAWGV